MTINELKKELAKLPEEMGNCQVVMSRDAEGNNFSPLVDVSDDGYCENDREYSIEPVYFDQHGWKGNCFESKKAWKEYKREAKRIVIFWPMN